MEGASSAKIAAISAQRESNLGARSSPHVEAMEDTYHGLVRADPPSCSHDDQHTVLAVETGRKLIQSKFICDQCGDVARTQQDHGMTYQTWT